MGVLFRLPLLNPITAPLSEDQHHVKPRSKFCANKVLSEQSFESQEILYMTYIWSFVFEDISYFDYTSDVIYFKYKCFVRSW